MEILTKDNLDLIKSSEWTVLFIYANGCKYCELAKPKVLEYSKQYPSIQFLQSDLMDILEYYNRFAEKEQEIVYQEIKDQPGEMIAIPQFNEDGSPKFSIRYTIPCLMVHHTKAQTMENPTGYIGAFNNTNEDEFISICNQIVNFR